jgi:hypothetical protein
VACASRHLPVLGDATEVVPRHEIDPGARVRGVEPEAVGRVDLEAHCMGPDAAWPTESPAQEMRRYFVEEPIENGGVQESAGRRAAAFSS